MIAVKQSSATETTQPCQSNEPCGKLRRQGIDETRILVDARVSFKLRLLSRMLT